MTIVNELMQLNDDTNKCDSITLLVIEMFHARDSQRKE